GLVGFGHLGQYLFEQLVAQPAIELAFVWNRTRTNALRDLLPAGLELADLADFASRSPDLIVEVAHPCVTQRHGADFLAVADYLMGSPTALADAQLEAKLRSAAETSGRTLFVPAGALWGGPDIERLAESGGLRSLQVTMTKRPDSFRFADPEMRRRNEEAAAATEGPTVLYEGPVRSLCPLAPNNVNTMAAAAVCATNLGFDGVVGRLRADPGMPEAHLVEVEAEGPDGFRVCTRRFNPAAPGAVTGGATFRSFLASVLRAAGARRRPAVRSC
ncbi:hypothetical protein BOX15_Mlig017120g2, partial [Macrostomum lignano]